MKKLIIYVVLLLAALGVRSQDTLYSNLPKEGYLYDEWLDTNDFSLYGYVTGGAYSLYGKRCTGKDKTEVYGIAVGFIPLYWYVHNPSTDSLYEYTAIYVPLDDTLICVSDSLLVQANTPPSYYYQLSIPRPSPPYLAPTLPVYEVYFNTPVMVPDTFYLGITRRTYQEYQGDDTSGLFWYEIAPLALLRYQSYGCNYNQEFTIIRDERPESVVWFGGHYRGVTYWFPILTPPEHTPTDTIHSDTTHVDTTHIDTIQFDTVGIAMRLLERYVNLQPNPAAERVLVTSSFGLQQLEVYNAAGAKVHEQKATGYSATLDVDALPAGPYLVRIATPSGTVTKKLVVQRR